MSHRRRFLNTQHFSRTFACGRVLRKKFNYCVEPHPTFCFTSHNVAVQWTDFYDTNSSFFMCPIIGELLRKKTAISSAQSSAGVHLQITSTKSNTIYTAIPRDTFNLLAIWNFCIFATSLLLLHFLICFSRSFFLLLPWDFSAKPKLGKSERINAQTLQFHSKFCGDSVHSLSLG